MLLSIPIEMRVLLFEPLNVTSCACTDAPQLVTGGDVQCLQIVVAEGAVGNHVGTHVQPQ